MRDRGRSFETTTAHADALAANVAYRVGQAERQGAAKGPRRNMQWGQLKRPPLLDVKDCYAVGSTGEPMSLGVGFPENLIAGSTPLSVPPTARIPKPMPESKRAMPTMIPNSESDSAM